MEMLKEQRGKDALMQLTQPEEEQIGEIGDSHFEKEFPNMWRQ